MSNAENYYDEMADHYEEIVRNWGYNMPETMVYNLAKYANLSKNKPFAILKQCTLDVFCSLKHPCILKTPLYSMLPCIFIDSMFCTLEEKYPCIKCTL